jgi:hypothetical protein
MRQILRDLVESIASRIVAWVLLGALLVPIVFGSLAKLDLLPQERFISSGLVGSAWALFAGFFIFGVTFVVAAISLGRQQGLHRAVHVWTMVLAGIAMFCCGARLIVVVFS